MHLVIVSGRSGAGKSSVLGVLEDMNFYCIDNLPAAMLEEAVTTLFTVSPGRNLAVSIDIRTLGQPTDVPELVASLKPKVSRLDVVFMDASDESLGRRFSETRRLHPLSTGLEGSHLSEAFKNEHLRLEPIRVCSNLKIDSSELSIHALRQQIREFASGQVATKLILKLQSFGFKKGVPMDSDTVFDVRALPNPYWEAELREFTGRDQPIEDYLRQFPETGEMLSEIETHMRRWIPRHNVSGRQYFTLSVGCTGGKHRSVYLIEELNRLLNDVSDNLIVVHRDLSVT